MGFFGQQTPKPRPTQRLSEASDMVGKISTSLPEVKPNSTGAEVIGSDGGGDQEEYDEKYEVNRNWVSSSWRRLRCRLRGEDILYDDEDEESRNIRSSDEKSDGILSSDLPGVVESEEFSQNETETFKREIRKLLESGNAVPSKVEHIRQQESWDCGVACIMMALRWAQNNENLMHNSLLSNQETSRRHDILQALETQSIWTADLVYWINQNLGSGIRSYLFCSNKLDVEDEYREFSYYKVAFEHDSLRVKRKFEELRRMNAPLVRVQNLPLEYILNNIYQENCIAIALVDNSILNGLGKSSYVGHYIILTGVSSNVCDMDEAYPTNGSKDDIFLAVVNPGNSNRRSLLSLDVFERAWRAEGTDNDIIFITK